MKPLLLAALTVPATVATVQGVQHAQQAHHPQGFLAHVHGMVAQRLQLTPEQRDAAHRVLKAHHPSLHAKAEAAFRSRADVVQALADARTTEGQIRDLEAKASVAFLDLELEVSQVVKDVDPVLTDAQRTNLRQMVADLRAHVEAFHSANHSEKASS